MDSIDTSIIDQIYVTEYLRLHFEENIYKYSRLKKYYDPAKPTFFYGFCSKDWCIVNNHKAPIVMIWTGGDCDYKHNKRAIPYLKKIKKMPNIYHIAISKFIEKTLSKIQIRYVSYPFYSFNLDQFVPTKKGNCVYVYLSGQPDFYGYSTIKNKIMPLFPDTEFILTVHKKYYQNSSRIPGCRYFEKEELLEAYSKCFVALRLTPHDGLAATVQELGCMGIKTIWNGETPSSLSYGSLEDIIQHIKDEQATIGTIDTELSDKVKNFIKIKDEFYHLDNYTGINNN